jgi:hypothetical protein
LCRKRARTEAPPGSSSMRARPRSEAARTVSSDTVGGTVENRGKRLHPAAAVGSPTLMDANTEATASW